jgi:hypothetical protein
MVSFASQRVSKQRVHVISICWKFNIVMDTVIFHAWLRMENVPIYFLSRSVLSHWHCNKVCCSSTQVISFTQLITMYTIMLNISTRTSHLQASLIETLLSNPCTVLLTGVARVKWPLSQNITSLRLKKYIYIIMSCLTINIYRRMVRWERITNWNVRRMKCL